MIRLEQVTKEFTLDQRRFSAVDHVSLEVGEGEIYGVIGRSGAGKSTLLRLINRLEEPSEGRVFVDGVNMLALSTKELMQKRREIGMIFQQFNLFQQKSVFENIAYPLRLARLEAGEMEERVTEMLDFVGLTEKRTAYPSMLSGGQKQRVAIARALVQKPKVLLCDEATSALDPSSTAQIIELLRQSVARFHTTVVMITHQLEVAKDICDRIAVMEKGKIVEENGVEALFRSPQSRLAQEMIQALRRDEEAESWREAQYAGKVFRLSYPGKTADEPLLSRCVTECHVDVNILSGNINTVASPQGNSSVGYLYVEFIGGTFQVEQAAAYLRERGVLVKEVLA